MKKYFYNACSLMQKIPPLIFSMLVLAVIGMNLLANKSINTPVEWLALDCGILFSWLAFLSMDIITQCFGPKAASISSITALLLNLLMAFIFFVAKQIPGAWGESFTNGNEAAINTALNNTFGGTWYVILGSSIAFASSALINNFLNYGIGKLLKNNIGFGKFALRAYVSTFIGQIADNMIFALIVSRTFFGWTLIQCFMCALAGALLELIFEVVFSPFGYKISKLIMKQHKAKGDAI